ncbi:MAG TPA: hypothetical protein VMX38_06790 [Verrucomicrobiae bacterium]|nr:hypothetical protein [Verrucomicrobiae bacterium]
MSYFTEIFGCDAPIAKNASVPDTKLDDPLFDYSLPTGAGDALAKALIGDEFANRVLGDFLSDAIVGENGACIKLQVAAAVETVKVAPSTRKALRKRHVEGMIADFRKLPLFVSHQHLTLDDGKTVFWDKLAGDCVACLEGGIADELTKRLR